MKDFSGEIEYTTRTNPDVPQRDITIIEMLDDICTDMEFFNRTSMLIALKENGVKVLTNMKVKNIGGGAVEIENTKTGACQSVGADTVVLAGGLKPRPLPGMPARGMQVIRIGDSRQPGRIMDAIYNGHYIAREI